MSTNDSRDAAPGGRRNSPRHADFIRNDLKAYVDGELSGLRRRFIAGHIQRCQACQEEVEGLRRISEEIKELTQISPRPELRARILANLPATPPGRSINLLPASLRATGGQRRQRLTLIGSAVCAVLLVGAFALGRVTNRFIPSPHTTNSQNVNPQQLNQQGGLGAGFARQGSPSVRSNAAPPAIVSSPTIARGSSRSANQETSNPSGSANDGYVMHDPYSIEADQRVAREMAREAELAIREQQQSQTERRQAAPGAPDHGSGTPENPLRLAVAVSDADAAHKQLLALVQNMGGKLTPSPSQTIAGGASPGPTVPGAAQPGKLDGGGAADQILVVHVPAAHAGDFRSALAQLSPAKKIVREQPASADSSPIHAQKDMTNGELPAASKSSGNRNVGPIYNSRFVERRTFRPVPAQDWEPGTVVTFLVRLHVSGPAQPQR